ncbi:alpha/beta hydrolase [Rossellomorea vietnamensis]|uniref:Alpha/beta hydrolase n=1 Tax=Rossellomorea vietnamensis TaxID=218284 RepID=A0A5D4MHJ6_9BACI|nr:alpha/beta hydrolase [Rossellomorea vietnamensis]TYS01375.1 alpha/beta hydrolase [Rossellomorea vietnamensis]
MDKKIIGDVFKYTKLEQDMPKLTTKDELSQYNATTMVIAGKKDIFFPGSSVSKTAKETIPNLISIKTYDMGHFPSEENLININKDIADFLSVHY